MSQPLTDAINALTTYANEITGQSDTTLSDAVESLVDGYGGGGGAGIKYYLPSDAELISTNMLTWNLSTDTDFDNITPSTSSQTIKSAGGNSGWYSLSSLDWNNYEYCVQVVSQMIPTYTSTPANTYAIFCRNYYIGFIANNSVINSITGKDILDTKITHISLGNQIQPYYNNKNVLSWGNISQGIILSTPNLTVSGSVIGIATPAVSIKGGSYMSVDSFNLVDSANTDINLKYNVYRYKKGIATISCSAFNDI